MVLSANIFSLGLVSQPEEYKACKETLTLTDLGQFFYCAIYLIGSPPLYVVPKECFVSC